MAKEYYDRYQEFKVDGKYKILPFIDMEPKPTDKTVTWKIQRDRMDKLSQEFYGTPYFGWLILMANPKYGGLENDISDGSVLIIPFPLVNSLQDYKKALDTHFFYYGR